MTRWSSLQALVRGRVRLPGDPGFADAHRPYNARYLGIRPGAVLSVADANDVAPAIKWAREHSLPVVARGGGHSYASHSLTTGLVLDLRGLDEVRVDSDTGLVTVGGGTRMRALTAALRRHDLAFPLGNADEVGIGGLVLGGGVAAVSRSQGLTCDWLVETTIVLADGRVLACSATDHADLFWACRGGGGGNFGVNISFTFRSAPPPDCATCVLLWPWRDAQQVFAVMQEVMSHAPDELAVRIGANRTVGADGTVSVVGQLLGSAEQLRTLLAPALAVGPPSRVDLADHSYWGARETLLHSSVGYPFAACNRVSSNPLPEAAVVTLLDAVEEWSWSSHPEGAGIGQFAWGGAINRVPATETAFPHRAAMYLFSMTAAWNEHDPPDVEAACVAWLARRREQMREYAPDAAYANFADPELADWRDAYYGPNRARLEEIKHYYDPDRTFDFPQAI